MKVYIRKIIGGRLQLMLIACFALVAAFTIIVSTVATTRLITDFLEVTENERVARDMNLANTFYRLKLQDIYATSYRLATDTRLQHNFEAAAAGDNAAQEVLKTEIERQFNDPTCSCTNLALILDRQGNVLAGQVRASDQRKSISFNGGNWGNLPIVRATLANGIALHATEIIPAEYLAQVGLAEQATIALIPTDRAAAQPFHPLEGSAGFALVGTHPVRTQEGELLGAVVSLYLFNNDFTLVERIQQTAAIDTVTVFFGDLRVATNVLNADGSRAVGTRVSQEVYDVVLDRGAVYVGRAYVVNAWYITRYEPLRDHTGAIVGSLYVGARVSAFQNLLQSLTNRVLLIALISVFLAAIVAIPIARVITRPVGKLVEANRKLANGDMSVRVAVQGKNEITLLIRSFNSMVETLQQAQEKLLHQEKLASIGQLAAGVAHEINNPLATILLFADILHNDLPPTDPRRQDLIMISNEAQRCKNIVAALLNFARQQEVLTQKVDLHQLVDETIERLCRQPKFEGIEIQRDYDPNLPTIHADSGQLRQVFDNLLNNAADAIENGGMIMIGTRAPDDKNVEIRISNNGQIITEENLGKLFTPFFTTKPPGKGTGLGLSIVYGIVKMHRGQISVQSQADLGTTTFTIILPVNLPQGQLASGNGSLIG